MVSKYAANKDDHFYRYPEDLYVKPFRIFGNLYYVGNSDVGAHLIDTGEGLILIDTTYPTTDALLINSIWEAGFQPKDIKYILHSHGHSDHFGATPFLTALYGAKTFLGAEDAKMFRERPELALINNKYSFLDLFVPDVEMNDGDIIRLGNTAIRIVSTPGHTDGVVSFFFDITESGRTYTAGMHGGAGLNTLCRAFIEKYHLPDSRDKYLKGLDRVRNEKVDITLGNHAFQNHTVEKREQMLKNPDGPNPFVNPSEWPAFIDGLRDKFYEMLAAEENGTDQV